MCGLREDLQEEISHKDVKDPDGVAAPLAVASTGIQSESQWPARDGLVQTGGEEVPLKCLATEWQCHMCLLGRWLCMKGEAQIRRQICLGALTRDKEKGKGSRNICTVKLAGLSGWLAGGGGGRSVHMNLGFWLWWVFGIWPTVYTETGRCKWTLHFVSPGWGNIYEY